MPRRPRPVIVELRGRLGNQLFQFAAGWAVARTQGAELLFSIGRTPRELIRLPELIGPLFREASARQLLRVGSIPSPRPDRSSRNSELNLLCGRAVNGLTKLGARPLHIRGPSASGFDASVLDATTPCLLRGWFENERYFAAFADEITDHLHLPDEGGLARGDLPSPRLGVGFRRDDLVPLGLALPTAYYENALRTVVERVSPASIEIHTDDPDFGDTMIPLLQRYVPVVHNAARRHADAIDGLAALAACDHWIIPNSTFAWWAAWLGERRHAPGTAIVVAPRPWTDKPEIVPERWLTAPLDDRERAH